MKETGLLIGLLLAVVHLPACATSTPVPEVTAQVTVPIEIVGSSPIVEIQVNGLPVKVHFDLGNSDSLSLFPSLLDQVDKVQIGETSGRASLYGPEDDAKPIYEVDLVQIGDLRFSDVALVEDFHDAEFQADFTETRGAYGFMGPGLFPGHKLVIDYQRKELTVIAPDVPASQQSGCRGWEVPLITDRDAGVLTRAKTEIGEVVFVWDTGAPANIVLKDRTDAANLDLPEYDVLALEQLSFNNRDFGPANFYVRDFDIPPFDGLIGHDFFVDHVVCVDLSRDLLLIRK